ncbi:MAG: hypothetical protein Q7J68_08365 [Thermoplasmata archaeon]|nr:hypothetical protein [Thermoplasmata archaeon]
MTEVNALIGVNHQVAQTLDAYLDYCARLVESVVNSKSYNTDKFKEISDDLIITPEEIVQLVDKLQVAYSKV